MNKIPKCNNNNINNNKKIIPLKINKKSNKESVCGKMKMKILSNKSMVKTISHDATNLSKNKKNNIKINKKSSSCNDKVSI